MGVIPERGFALPWRMNLDNFTFTVEVTPSAIPRGSVRQTNPDVAGTEKAAISVMVTGCTENQSNRFLCGGCCPQVRFLDDTVPRL